MFPAWEKIVFPDHLAVKFGLVYEGKYGILKPN